VSIPPTGSRRPTSVPFPQPVVVAPPAPLVSAVEHPAPVQRVAADQPLPPIAPLPPPPISQLIPDVPEASGSPQAPTPPPTLQHKTTACWTEVQPQPADNRTTTNYLRHVNKAIDGTCRITAVQHDTSATSGTFFDLVRSKTGTEYRVPCHSLVRDQSAAWQRSDSLLNAADYNTCYPQLKRRW
jgi:hypothetical protein